METKYKLTGQKFGSLTALEYIPGNKELKKNGVWLCLCDCGNKIFLTGWKLVNNYTQSCGCLIQRTPEQTIDAGISQIVRGLKNRKYSCDLTNEEVKSLIFLNCAYCGAVPEQECRIVGLGRKRFLAFKYNGLDRVDNNIGYTSNNVLPCCIRCNRGKGDLSLEDFIEWLKNISQNFPYRNI